MKQSKIIIKIIFSFSALLFYNTILSQGHIFSISARTQYISDISNNSNRTSSIYRIKDINDSLYTRTYFETKTKYKHSYSPKIGYDIIGNIKFNITKRLIIRTGLGLNFISFNNYTEVDSYESIQIGIDTVPKQTNNPSTPSFSSCDNYINNYEDAGEIKKGVDYHIISLKIPFEINHLFLSNKLNLGLGIFIQTPLYSSKTDEYITLEQLESNGITSCKYVKISENDKSGNNLNNMQVGLSGNLAYNVFKNFAIEIGLTKEFRNIFYPEENNQYNYFTSRYEYNPLKMHIGLEYQFGKNVSKTINN